MKVYVTKYLFTKGIEEVEVRKTQISSYVQEAKNLYPRDFHGNDWHKTLAEAKTEAKKMIASKRKSIASTLRKLDDLEKSL